ncbi:hypothetical protein [Methylovorus glucosotrophus]|uniref:Uncharacterized protein n=1 Tax=Methylovorus glucosotrophus (strain SIP3-4) TaxID=582744 RepID=C6X7X4_METGS|nr:hypothetical protein [Methylovorus glucosotrophus]ACT51301.1 hypothetical protein Msip34_2059 [Methylovorus glucosotrophus SIP3-4]
MKREVEYERENEIEYGKLIAYKHFLNDKQIEFIDNELLNSDVSIEVWNIFIKEIVESEVYGFFNAIEKAKEIFDIEFKNAIIEFRKNGGDITEEKIILNECVKSKLMVKKIIEFSML